MLTREMIKVLTIGSTHFDKSSFCSSNARVRCSPGKTVLIETNKI